MTNQQLGFWFLVLNLLMAITAVVTVIISMAHHGVFNGPW